MSAADHRGPPSSRGLRPPDGAWGSRPQGGGPGSPTARRLWAPAQIPAAVEKGRCRKRPGVGDRTLLPQALRNVALPGSGVPPPASTCWPNTSGISRVLITVPASGEALARVNRAVAGNCHFLTTSRPLTVGQSHRRGALQGLSAARRHRRLSIEQVSVGVAGNFLRCCQELSQSFTGTSSLLGRSAQVEYLNAPGFKARAFCRFG